MDNLSYAYNLSGGWLQNNKLRHVTDAVTTTPTGYGDLKNGQASDNYGYDAIGNLIKDESEGIASGGIEWNVYGKISQITKTNGGVTTVIKYTYDATGNRIGKWVQVGAGTPKQTAYVRDASGNVMAIYEKGNSEVNGGLLSQIEVPLYGSSRLGVWRPDREVETTGWELFDTDPMTGTGGGIAGGWERGRVQFELSNHLGNVLVTISDARTAVDDGTYQVLTACPTCLPGFACLPCYDVYIKQNSTPDDVVDYYLPQILSANDYYPGGMDMPGRLYSSAIGYRYGFNGKEKDTEGPVQYDYGFRIYDPRLVRFKSVDPLTKSYPWYIPYQFAGNNPIKFIDVDGLEEADPAHYLYYDKPKIDMNGAPSSSSTNAQGFPRNAKYFWQQMLSNYPEYFSPDNIALINKGYSPWVDEIWAKSFPSDAAYMDNKLIHHHTQGKNMAVAIPEQMHWDNFSELHAYLRKAGAAIRGARVTGTLNGVINILGFASDITGIIKDNPDALGNQFSKGATTFEENIDRVVNQHFGDGPFLDQYIVIREVVKTTTTQYNSKGEVIAQFVSSRFFKAEIYSDYVWDEDQGKYIGVNLYGTQVGVYNYDKDGKVVSSVEKRSDMSLPVITNGNPSSADIEKVRNN